jgi:deoxycytidine triphosphate deaminase
VKGISLVDPLGQLDFGGSEYKAAGRVALATRRIRAEDRYEWWELERGCYFAEFNETLELAEDEIALLEPDERLLRAGAVHVPMFLRGRVAPVETLLQVGALRLKVKQNARISRVRIFRFAAPGARALRPATGKSKKKKAKLSRLAGV